jgi:hypothetical protein
MVKSPNFLLQTTVPWERISLRLDLVNVLGVSGNPKINPYDPIPLSIIPTYRRYLTSQACLAHIADPCTCACITSLQRGVLRILRRKNWVGVGRLGEESLRAQFV